MRAVVRKMPPVVSAAFVGYVLYSVYVCMTFYSPTTISSVVEIGYLPKALYLFFIILGRMIALAAMGLIPRVARSRCPWPQPWPRRQHARSWALPSWRSSSR